MEFLFVNLTFENEIEHIAKYLAERGHRCVFACQEAHGPAAGIRRLLFEPDGKPAKATYDLSKRLEEAVRRGAGIYDRLRPLRKKIHPDLIVAHAGFGSTLFLPELFPGVPFVNYFEYYCHPHNSALDFRPEWGYSERRIQRVRAGNALMLLDLENCTAGWTPTSFQKSQIPEAYRSKIRVIRDPVDTEFWSRRPVRERRLGKLRFDADTRIVTYVARGLESTRGFDIFLKVAKKIYRTCPNVVFLVVGNDRAYYGPDLQYIREKSFLEHAWNQREYDPRRFVFLGYISRETLAQVFSLSDLHIYLTIPFTISWTLLEAMSCECTILASDTVQVREEIRERRTGLLCDFFDVDGLARRALDVLRAPKAYRRLGRAARERIAGRHRPSLILPRTASFFREVARAAKRR
jgi:glycosyltransferase involved in cell wall biosynthesis